MTSTGEFDLGRLERVTDHLQKGYVDPGRIAGCQLHIMQRGRPVYQRNFGSMDIERRIPVADDTIFRIYSMTKPVTSVALMMLFEQGRFQLDGPVSRFVPSWAKPNIWVSGEGASMVTRPAPRDVTFRDLLTHRSGLTYGGELPSVGIQHPVDHSYRALGIRSLGGTDNAATFLDKLGQVPLRFEPGSAWMYSLATDACGALVELISGQTLDAFMRDNIFDPLGMSDTGFFVSDEQASRLAGSYFRLPDKTLRKIDDQADSSFRRKPEFASGGAGLVSTGHDYLRFCEMLRGGGALDGHRILSPRTVAMMRRNHLEGGADLAQSATDSFADIAVDGLGFGLGFAMTCDPLAAGWLSRDDYFWSGAASTFFWIDPEAELSVLFLTQLMPSGTFDFRGQLKSIIYSSLS